MKDYKKIIFLAALAALTVRFAFSFNAGAKPSLNEDDREYYELGRSLAYDGVLSEPLIAWEPSAHRGFLYPVYLSLFAGHSTEGWARAMAGVLAASLVLALLLAASSLELGLGALPLVLFVFAAARNFDPSLYIEQFYSLCVLLCAVLAVRWARNPGSRESVMLGLSLGISLTCRSSLVFLPPVLALWGLSGFKNVSKKAVLLLVLCSYLPLAAWTARNAFYFGRFIPLDDGAASGVLYTASVGLDHGMTMDDITERFFKDRPELRGNEWAKVSAAMTAAALHNISARPAAYVYGVLRRMLIGMKMAFGQSGWLVLPALLAAGWLARRDNEFLILGVFALYFVAVHSFMSVSDRYFTPLAPVLCLMAAYCWRGADLARISVRGSGFIAPAVLSAVTLLWLWGNVCFIREAAVLRGAGLGLHKRALSLMNEAGGCEAAGLLAASLSKPSSNPATRSKLYSDSAVASYFCSKDTKAAVRFLKEALAADPDNFGARTMLDSLGGDMPG